MLLILLLYFLMACTFTIAKIAMFYMKPIYFIGLRMVTAGVGLLAYFFACRQTNKLLNSMSDIFLFAQLTLFHIYFAYIGEFWSLQYLTSGNVALLYSLSPFITALLTYCIFGHRLSLKKWRALILGFIGMIPVLQGDTFFSLGSHHRTFLPEIVLLGAVACAAYGWLVMKQLIDKGYTIVFINGVSMFLGGAASLGTALSYEGKSPLIINDFPSDMFGVWLIPHLGSFYTTVTVGVLCMILLIGISNVIGYNLYGYLLTRYSPTFLSFAGFITPFFSTILGWFFLSERLTITFILSFLLTILSLYLFYEQELIQEDIKNG